MTQSDPNPEENFDLGDVEHLLEKAKLELEPLILINMPVAVYIPPLPMDESE